LTSPRERIDLKRMAARNPAVDAYIAKSPDFAKPILIHLRQLAHAACPEIEETLKWRMPHFVRQGIVFGMGAFKQHCMMHFWKGKLLFGSKAHQDGMGHFGRISAVSDLPKKKILLGYIKKAVELNQSGVKKAATKPTSRKKPVVPADFSAALNKNKKARAAFENFSYSHKKEYLQWITEAKREETRARRIKTAIQWLAQGKPRNWKYLDC
jgi:uncharacterized protein YdeI (YjbR/CyaY-like superfamily)